MQWLNIILAVGVFGVLVGGVIWLLGQRQGDADRQYGGSDGGSSDGGASSYGS
jgi:hypothetical protein